MDHSVQVSDFLPLDKSTKICGCCFGIWVTMNNSICGQKQQEKIIQMPDNDNKMNEWQLVRVGTVNLVQNAAMGNNEYD